MKRPLPIYLLLPVLFAACDAQESPSYEGEPVATIRGSVSANQSASVDASAAILWFVEDQYCDAPVADCGGGVVGDDSTDFECADACISLDCTPEALQDWEDCVSECGGVVSVQSTVSYSACSTAAVGEAVAVNTETFPSKFEIELFDVPSDDKLVGGRDGEPRVALGFLVALESQAPATFDFAEGADFETLVGGVESHMLIYAADPVTPDSAWGQYLGGTYDVGFHLVQFVDAVECGDEIEGCTFQPESRIAAPEGLATELSLRLAPIGELNLPF